LLYTQKNSFPQGERDIKSVNETNLYKKVKTREQGKGKAISLQSLDE
jgi:hypothetical protein